MNNRAEGYVVCIPWSSAFFSQCSFFLIVNGYFGTLYLINRQITNLEVVPDTD